MPARICMPIRFSNKGPSLLARKQGGDCALPRRSLHSAIPLRALRSERLARQTLCRRLGRPVSHAALVEVGPQPPRHDQGVAEKSLMAAQVTVAIPICKRRGRSPVLSPIAIALCCNERYTPGLFSTVGSVLVHADRQQPFAFYVLDTGIRDRTWGRFGELVQRLSPASSVRRLCPDLNRFSGCPLLYGNLSTYARLLLPEMLPELERLLYLDVDLLVFRDISELWHTPFNGKTAVAVCDSVAPTLAEQCDWLTADDPERTLPAFSAGVLLLDLVRWRALNYGTATLSLLREYGSQLRFWDQSLLNYLMRHDKTLLAASWNTQSRFGKRHSATSDACIVHFIGYVKPWLRFRELPEFHLYLHFCDLFLGGLLPAAWRFHPLPVFRSKKERWRNLAGFGRAVLAGLLLKCSWGRRALLQQLKREPRHADEAFWLERWLTIVAESPAPGSSSNWL